ncbi:FAD-binding oxidoreductase [Agaribacterium haliotis]|uniref:FAD-binding oxidoreductase n=1 Tax=Agaribacterium haliotis TaxID=2013869 RepID=UPI001EFDB6D7|nr:FAD-binding oxidoreductase [Agaribacterium haliotis]
MAVFVRICVASIFFSAFFSKQAAVASTLVPFTSDGCSAFPDGTSEQEKLWLECCTAHDFAYWQGGSYLQRIEADVALQQCVSGLGEHSVALIMLAGVRIGGSPYFPTQFRWGYGWPYPRNYGPLTDDEQKQVLQLSPGF